MSQSRADCGEGSSEPERFIVAGDKIIVFVHGRARRKGTLNATKCAWPTSTFRNGKAIQMRAFADRQQALEWAGVKDSTAHEKKTTWDWEA